MTHQAFTVKELTALADGHPYREFLRRRRCPSACTGWRWPTPTPAGTSSTPARFDSTRRRCTPRLQFPGMERHVIRGDERGDQRLQILARCWRPTTAALFDRVGLAPGMRCLDLGCGSGHVSVELARRVGPDGSVVGIDMDAVTLALAGESAAKSGSTTSNSER